MDFNMADIEIYPERPPSPLRRQRACKPCSAAKARCQFETDNVETGCERCRRMKIKCLPQTTKSLRRPRQIKPTTGNARNVDQINEGMASLSTSSLSTSSLSTSSLPSYGLAAASFATPVTYPDLRALPPTERDFLRASLSSSASPEQPGDAPFEYAYYAGSEAVLPKQPQPPPTLLDGQVPASPGFGLTWEDAQKALADFRALFLPTFPFVAIGHDTFAQKLYLEKPLLLRVILLVAAPLPASKREAIHRSVKAYIGQHLLVLEERNLGLLQGLLVFIAWGNHKTYLDQQITHLIYLAVGYAHSLGITRRPPSQGQKVRLAVNPEDAYEALYGKSLTTVIEKPHSLEEKRAFLGCCYILSVNSSQFGRQNKLKSDYVEECLDEIRLQSQMATDFGLDKIFRLQQIVERISETFPVLNEPDHNKAFAYLLNDEMRPLRKQLDKVYELVHHGHQQFTWFWTYHNYVLMRLYEPATYLSAPPSDNSGYRNQCLLYCLQAARSFFQSVLAIGPMIILYRPFVFFAQITSALVIASRLLFLHIDGWDLQHARQTLDLASIMDDLMAALAAAQTIRKQRVCDRWLPSEASADDVANDEDEALVKYAGKLRWIKVWFQSKLAAEGAFTPEDVIVPLPDIWASGETASNQFWLGLLGDVSWNFSV